MRQAAGVFAVLTAVLLQEAAGCFTVCNEGCRLARQMRWHQRTKQRCPQAGATLTVDAPADMPRATSCDVQRVQGAQGCDVEWKASSGSYEASCQAEGVCEIDWAVLSETCLCTPRPPGPCDGKCQDLPVCREGEQLARSTKEWQCGADELQEGTCREAEVCCVKSTCRKQPPVPVPARECRTQCGRRVASGETVQGDGTDYCNTCTCLEGSLSCTEKACTERQDPVCLSKGRACEITVWGNLQIMDRRHECPDLTRCTRGQSHEGFGFSFCDEKPRLCEQMFCIRAPCPCFKTDRIYSFGGKSITLDTELFTVEQARERWTVQLPNEAVGKEVVELWFGGGEDVPKELVVQGWTSEKLEGAQADDLSGDDVLAARPVINTVAKAMMITLTPAAVKTLSRGGSRLSLISVARD